MTMTEDTAQDGTEVERGNYRYACTAKQEVYDPANDIEAGRIEIIAGKCEDGVMRTVIDDENEDFLDITGEVIERFEADTRMTMSDIKTWAAEKANASEVGYSDV